MESRRMNTKTVWHQRLIENIYAINQRLIELEKKISFEDLCKKWGGFDFEELENGAKTFKFRVDDFEFSVGEEPAGGAFVLIGSVRLWLEQEKYKPFELMDINLCKFIEENKLKI